jgi:Ca-activated chloride channel family protein
MSGLRLASPWWLLALALVGVAAWWRGRRGVSAAMVFSSVGVLGPAVRAVQRRSGRWLGALRLGVLGLVVLGLARPQVEKAEIVEDARGINLMLALDYSGTMRTRDVVLDGRRVARSTALVGLTGEFIRARTNDRIGLVTFDRDAFLASPLTLDRGWLMERLAHETNGTGTDMGSALAVAAQHLQKHTNETRVIVLMTDAENISAGPEPAAVAEVLRPLGIRLHCVQILSPNQGGYRDDVSEALTHAAVRTGGQFFPVRTGADLRAVYGEIDRLEKQKLSETKQKGWRELFPWLIVPALGLMLAEQAMAHTRWRRVP